MFLLYESDCNGYWSGRAEKRAVWLRLNVHNLGRIPDSWYPCCIAQSCAHNQSPFVHAPCPLRPPALTGGPEAEPFSFERVVHSNLPTVCVAAQYQIHSSRDDRIVFGMMREQDMIAGSGAEVHKSLRIRLVSSSYPSNPVQILSAWVSRLGGVDCTEGSIVRNVAGGQASQNYFLAVHSDGVPIIIQGIKIENKGRMETKVWL